MHLPVLAREAIDGLGVKLGDVVLDGTLGGGGHAAEILKRITPGGKLIAVEKDPVTFQNTRQAFGKSNDIVFVNEDFRRVEGILGSLGIGKLDGALFDLGMSSLQLDDPQRGFSFNSDGPLDMRFDQRQELTAKYVVNSFSPAQLEEIIRSYGEERYAALIAKAILKERRTNKLVTTAQLSILIKRTVGYKYRKQRINPSARTFQALRMYVNDELGALEEAVKKTVGFLRPGGRICVISFHSLEDRIVKNIFKAFKAEGSLKIITKKPLCPVNDEINANPRARSAKLRVAERTG